MRIQLGGILIIKLHTVNDNDHKLMSGDLLFLFSQNSWHQQQQIDKHHKHTQNNVNVSSRAGI